jgi:hypothetical protein
VPSPQILWPSAIGYGDNGGPDSARFPPLDAIKARLAASPPESLSAFSDAARNAQDRILILDDYLFKPKHEQSLQSRYDKVLYWFPDGLVANDVRILTNAHGDEREHNSIRQRFAEQAAAINDRSRNREGFVADNTDRDLAQDSIAMLVMKAPREEVARSLCCQRRHGLTGEVHFTYRLGVVGSRETAGLCRSDGKSA